MIESDRRHALRHDINREFASVGDFISEYVTNISASGVFIRSDDPLPVGTKVNLRFSVIMDEIEIIEGIGEVVRQVLKGEEEFAGMGVVFVEMTGVSQQIIEKLLLKR
jgi:uncharacterized protein (TIGR02266 family)